MAGDAFAGADLVGRPTVLAAVLLAAAVLLGRRRTRASASQPVRRERASR